MMGHYTASILVDDTHKNIACTIMCGHGALIAGHLQPHEHLQLHCDYRTVEIYRELIASYEAGLAARGENPK